MGNIIQQRTKVMNGCTYQKAAQAAVHVHADVMLERQGRQLLDWVHTSVGVLPWLRMLRMQCLEWHHI